jgi:hypothetical protein
LTDEKQRKIDYYFTKYIRINDINEKEGQLLTEMSILKASVELYNIAYKGNDEKGKTGSLKSYTKEKDKIEQMLK